MQAFARVGRHIRQLEWIHQSDSAISASSILQCVDLSQLNLHSLLLSGWSNELDAQNLLRFVESSADRISIVRLRGMEGIQGDLFKVLGLLSRLQHFSLTMTEESVHSHRSPNNPPSAVPNAETEWTSADSLLDLMDACPRLTTIEVRDLRPSMPAKPTSSNSDSDSGLDSDSDSDVASVKEMSAPRTWQRMEHLTTLNLQSTTISGSTLSGIFARCPRLMKINLSQTSPLYLSGFHLDSFLTMDTLSILMFSGCHFLDGHGYKEIFKACPMLVTLDISHTNVDDAALGALGHHCLQLANLNMDSSRHITDQGIRDMLSHKPTTRTTHDQNSPIAVSVQQQTYQNHTLRNLSVLDCSELTGLGIRHILMTCAQLKDLEIQQPELSPQGLFPSMLESDEDDEPTTIYPEPESTNGPDAINASLPWACHSTLEHLQIKNLNIINSDQTKFLNTRLRELSQLKTLHIGGSQLELSVLNGLGHRLNTLYIDDLAREVNLDDVRWFVDHTPNLTRLWCRQLIRHSEPWKLLRSTREHLKLW